MTSLNPTDVPLVVSWFPTATPNGPALGDPESTTWAAFASVFWWRRTGQKDGPLFCPARFQLEADGRHVRRIGRNVATRTLVALDVEANKQTGEIPPSPGEAVRRMRGKGWAGLVYTSYSHVPLKNIRFRVVLPLSDEIDGELPAPEVVAEALGLSDVLDRSKLNPASVFYLPSCPSEDALDQHETHTCDGNPLATAWVIEAAGDLLAERHAEQDRVANEAREQAAERREAKIAAGFDPDDSLIEKLRPHFDLEEVLLSHGYDKRGTKYRHPNSQSGCYGADIKSYGGIDRVYSHNANDPLHRDNLPDWCGGVTAIDVVDVVTILDFGGDRTRALRELALRFRLTPNAPPFRRLWDATAAIDGTVAATWLETIGLGCLIACPDLRFHPACRHPEGVLLPALVAAVRSLDGELVAIHRVYLRADGSGLADMAVQRAALGVVMGGAIRLTMLEDAVAAGELVLAEDLEEAASLGLLLRRPAWAAGTAANLAAGIVLPPEIRRLAIAAVGTNGAPRFAWYRFGREGRAVQTASPGNGAAAFNVVVQHQNLGVRHG
jgi:hypothetical protein